MRNDDIGIGGNQLPVLVDRSTPGFVEGPAIKPGRNGRAPDVESLNDGPAVVQVSDALRDELLNGLKLFLLEKEIVVAGNKHFVLKGQCTEPGQEVDNLGTLTPIRHIACMNDQVATGYSYTIVSAMGVSDGNNSQLRED